MRRRTPIIRPPRLRHGDLVRVISPSLPSLAFAGRRYELGVAVLEKLGLKSDFSENAWELSDDGLTAGSAEVRAADLHAAFLDPDVGGILCAVGGFRSADLLPLLDPDLIRTHAKPLIGRSDNTYLNAFLLEAAGITSYSGAAFVTQLADARTAPSTLDSFAQVLLGDGPTPFTTSPQRTEVNFAPGVIADGPGWPEAERLGRDVWLRPGHAVGRLVGGEIGIVASLLEMNLMSLEDCVFWVDVVDAGVQYFLEQLARLEPMVADVGVRSIVVADNPSVPFDTWLATVQEAVPRLARTVTGPVLVGGDIGHYQPSWLLPYGDVVEVDSTVGITANLWRRHIDDFLPPH